MPKTLPEPWTQEWKAQFTHHHDAAEATLLETMHTMSKDDMLTMLGSYTRDYQQADKNESGRRTDAAFAAYGVMHLIQLAYLDEQENPDGN